MNTKYKYIDCATDLFLSMQRVRVQLGCKMSLILLALIQNKLANEMTVLNCNTQPIVYITSF